MAIIRKGGKANAFDDAPAESTEETDEMPMAPAAEAKEETAEGEGGETATLDLSMLGGQSVNPGDVVKLEVVSVSPDDGTLTVKYAQPKTGGVDKAAAVFNEGP